MKCGNISQVHIRRHSCMKEEDEFTMELTKEEYPELNGNIFVNPKVNKAIINRFVRFLVKNHQELCCVKEVDDYSGCGYAKQRLKVLKRQYLTESIEKTEEKENVSSI